jgi:hypothetical protein
MANQNISGSPEIRGAGENVIRALRTEEGTREKPQPKL